MFEFVKKYKMFFQIIGFLLFLSVVFFINRFNTQTETSFKKIDPYLIEIPEDYNVVEKIELDKTIDGDMADVFINSKIPDIKFSVDGKWVSMSFDVQQEKEAEIVEGKPFFRDVLPGVDVSLDIRDGYVQEKIIVKDKNSQKEFYFNVKYSDDIYFESEGGHIKVVSKDTGEGLFLIRRPQGVDAQGKAVDFKYNIEDFVLDKNKKDEYIRLRIYPYRMEQFRDIKYPIYIQPSFQSLVWDEALVKVGSNGDGVEYAKDGDIIAIKPAGWNWGLEERKKNVIIKIPKLSRQIRDSINSKLEYSPDADKARKEIEYRVSSAIKYGIDYTVLSSEQDLENIRNPEKISPILDARDFDVKSLIQEKKNYNTSVVPTEKRLVYGLQRQNSLKEGFLETFIKKARAATIVTKSIGAGSCGGVCDYSTVAAWEAACGGATSCDLVTNNEAVVGEMYDDATFNETVFIDGFITDSTRTVTLSVASGERHSGVIGAGVDWTYAGRILEISDNYVTVEWIQFRDWGGGSTYKAAIGVYRDYNVIRNNILYGGATPDPTTTGILLSSNADGSKVYNNIVYKIATSGTDPIGIGIFSDANPNASNEIYNNTVYSAKYGIACVDTTNDCIVKNNISMNSTVDFAGTFNTSSSHNMSSDATGDDPGVTGAIINETASSEFVSVTSGSEDFHLLSSANAVDAGTSLSTVFTDDIDGESRPTNWDMGADEYVVLANPPSIQEANDNPDPVTEGRDIVFTVDWTDADAGETVKAKICKTNSLTNQNCDGGFWASSTAFTTNNPVSLTYTTLTGDVGTNNYYAFVCDDGGSCSSSYAETFTVESNSASTISSVVDTPDPTGPRRSVSFIINWNDNNTGETVKAKICKTNSLTNQNCDGGFWASSTAFTSLNPVRVMYDVVSADYGQTRTYYAFICDDDGNCTTGVSGTFTVNTTSNVPDVKIRGGKVRGGIKAR